MPVSPTCLSKSALLFSYKVSVSFMYIWQFHKNQILEIHIAQSWFLVLVEINVKKMRFYKYDSSP